MLDFPSSLVRHCIDQSHAVEFQEQRHREQVQVTGPHAFHCRASDGRAEVRVVHSFNRVEVTQMK